MKEVHILKSLKHSNIPIIYDIEEDDNYSYIIEEYLKGESLKAYRMRLLYLDERRIVEFISQICDLFQYLHAQNSKILYLDLKPDNILVYEGNLKLLDFGAAVYEREYKDLNYEVATAGYMAPERFRHQADERSDIYSIGCLLYFLITGTLYQPSCVSKKWTWVLIRNRRLCKLMEQCLNAAPSKRFQSVEELKGCLCKVSGKREYEKKSVVMSYCIAVAGSERRVGVTHISLLLADYLSKVNKGCIYVEWNEGDCLEQICSFCPGVEERGGYYFVNGIRIQKKEQWIANQEKERFCFCIKDYGMLTEQNQEGFLNETYKMLVVGTKPWEWKKSMFWMDKLCDCDSVLFLLNLIEGKEKVKGTILPKNSVFIPFIQSVFSRERREKERKILDSLVQYLVKKC